MRVVYLFIALSLGIQVSAHTFYVQDKAYNENARDINRGTDVRYPWATWQKAFNTARAGDTVYFRGGTWFPDHDNYGSVTEHHPASNRGYNGTPSNPICFFAYPPDVAAGNVPVLDCRRTHPSTSNHIGLRISNAKYLIFRGLTVTNVRAWEVESGEMWCAGILAQDCEHLTLEQMTASYVGGSGYFLKGLDTLYLTNCDAHHNCDSLDRSMPGGDGDGFNVQAMGEPDDTFRIAYISGCRAWNNSDDGFDIGSKKQLDVHDCWSWNNGDLEGDATGFKLCHSFLRNSSKRKLYNCIAAYNEEAGIVDLNLNSEIGPHMEYYNNSVYKCRRGFGSGPGNGFYCGISPAKVIYRNNIIYESSSENPASFMACDYRYPSYVIQDHNTWVQTGDVWHTEANSAYNVTDDDFVSLDSAQLRWPRKADGSLPDITFMALKSTSDLLDGGVDVGLPYKGLAPDLGAMEYGSLSVKLISPGENQTFNKGDNIILQASIEDAYDEISEVSFYSQKLKKSILGQGEPIEPNVWQFTWESNLVDYQSLIAVAVNSLNESATSSPVHVSIFAPVNTELYPDRESGSENMCKIIPNPNNGIFVLELEGPLDVPGDIHIISMKGQLMAVETMAKSEISKAMNLSHMEAGSYGLVFQKDDGSTTCQPLTLIKN